MIKRQDRSTALRRKGAKYAIPQNQDYREENFVSA